MKNRYYISLIFLGYTLLICSLRADIYVSGKGDDNHTGASWGQAVKTIQKGVDLASSGDTIWVTNGVYLTGGKVADGLILTNRVCIDKNLTLKSVNGPSVTYIFGTHNPLGAQAVRCMYVSGATKVVIDGFTFRNGGTHTTSPEDSGGGIYTKNHTIVTNCIFDECYANRYGGGIADGSGSELLLWAYNTQIKECEADSGGGVYRASVVNCTLSKNYARDKHGGGMYYGDAYNCVFSNNFAKMYGGGGV